MLWVCLFALVLCGWADGRNEANLVSVTFASDPKKAFFLLEGFSHHKHNRVNVLGKDNEFKGSVHKLEMLKEFLHSDSLKETDFLLVCDGYFTFVSCGQREFVEKFLLLGADIVFAAKDGHGSPDSPSSTRFKYLSSGAFIGRVRILREIFDVDFGEFSTDDQFYKSLFASKRWNIKLDVHKSLFCALVDHETDDSAIVLNTNSRFLLKETSSTPALLFGSNSEGMHAFYRLLRKKVQPKVRITDISVYPTTVRRGETVFFELTVANFNDFDLMPQYPDPGHVYNFSRTFVEDNFSSEFATFRIGVNHKTARKIDHPYRWGMGEKIISGNQKTVILGITMTECLDNHEFDLGYVFENFFWVINFRRQNVTVICD